MKLIFLEKQKREDDATSFIFQPKKKFTWKAGQYLFYTIPNNNPDNRGITRYFTISSAPFEEIPTITTRIFNKPTTFKKSLLKLKPGDETEANGPDGDFVVEDPKRNFVFIAGGIGITPFHSILKEADHRKQKISVNLLYANKNENSVFKTDLESFKKNNPKLKIEYFLSPEHIDEKKLAEMVYGKSSIVNPVFYISGPNSFVRAIRDMTKAQGVKKENIKTDMFSGYESIN